jgi:hypothetical protein
MYLLLFKVNPARYISVLLDLALRCYSDASQNKGMAQGKREEKKNKKYILKKLCALAQCVF